MSLTVLDECTMTGPRLGRLGLWNQDPESTTGKKCHDAFISGLPCCATSVIFREQIHLLIIYHVQKVHLPPLKVIFAPQQETLYGQMHSGS